MPDLDQIPAASNGTPLDVLMGYLSETTEVERWAWAKWGGKGHADFDAIKARIADIRERYCTRRVIAPELTASYGNDPDTDPKHVRVLEVRQIHRDRVRIVTMQSGAPEMGVIEDGETVTFPTQYEYSLLLVGGQWRLNPRTADFGDLGKVKGLL